MSDESTPFVARAADIDALTALWEGAVEGKPATLRLQAPFGGGRRAVSNAFLRTLPADTDAIVWRVNCIDQENGLQWLVRMYGSLVATLSGDAIRKGKIEMMLNALLPSQPKRVQTWYQQFIAGLKEAKTDAESGQVQLRIPQDNPLIGLVEIAAALAGKFPMVLEVQNPYVVNSVAFSTFIEALHNEARERKAKLLIVLHDEPDTDVAKAVHPMPLLDFYAREASIKSKALALWGADEVGTYLKSKDLKGDAKRIAEITGGRPGFVAELVEILEGSGKLGDLDGVTLSSLMPSSIDEDELDVPTTPVADGERKHAGPDEAVRITYLAALLGTAFPSNLVADMGGYDRDSVDDLLDAMGDLFEEVQFSQELQTWIYRFTRGTWREAVLEQNDNEEGHDLARRVGLFMERYLVPRGYGFIVKTARVYAEHEALGRAQLMRSLALSNDNPDVWGLAFDLMRYFDEVKWPDTLRRTVYMNLLDKMVGGGNLQVADRIHTEISEWATANDDKEMTAWLAFAGSRLDARRQDVFAPQRRDRRPWRR